MSRDTAGYQVAQVALGLAADARLEISNSAADAASCQVGREIAKISGMTTEPPASYLRDLPARQMDEVQRINKPGLAALRAYLAAGEAVAFLGFGVSSPPYPRPCTLIAELVDTVADRLADDEAATLRALVAESPEEVAEIIHHRLDMASYWELLRLILRARPDPETGNTWTHLQELVCRCPFRGIINTTYDAGIMNARMRVRPHASATSFTTWNDELGLDRWRTGEIFRKEELPVLFAHGQYGQPNTVLLATSEYRQAYSGKLAQVLTRLVDASHLVWIGFDFTDQRINSILQHVALGSGTHINLGAAPRHVAIMPWDPLERNNEPGVLARRLQIGYGAQVVLYPAPGGDPSSLRRLLANLSNQPITVDDRPQALSSSKTKNLATDAETHATSAGWVFVSYAHVDAAKVDGLQRVLESAGIRLWRDTANLWPGEDWRLKIRQAITSDALVFLACFSTASLMRKVSSQNEELTLAIEQMRLRLPGEPWIVPVRFDDCSVPDLDLGGGRSLASIMTADLFGERAADNAARLVTAVQRILSRAA